MRPDGALVEQLKRSTIFQDYEKAFCNSTELPLSLRPLEYWNLSNQQSRYQNPFCMLLAKTNRTCAACLEVQGELSEKAQTTPASVTCFAGLCDTAVPIQSGDRTIGLLQTGQVSLRPPTKERFAKITQQILEWGVSVDLRALEDAYFHSKVVSPRQYESFVQLLQIFSKHLALVANQIAIHNQNVESPLIRRAKAYIAGHHGDPLSLDQIAHALHVSTFYFCKLFKKATGMTFTDYLCRVRVEKAKNLLLNPHLRVSEIAYNVGFQSLTHFNRSFRKIAGVSPTQYRSEIPS
jgi:AraC-like DNA-binding protein/ligand-binding sensor protein